jgi:hypothetical protein
MTFAKDSINSEEIEVANYISDARGELLQHDSASTIDKRTTFLTISGAFFDIQTFHLASQRIKMRNDIILSFNLPGSLSCSAWTCKRYEVLDGICKVVIGHTGNASETFVNHVKVVLFSVPALRADNVNYL